MYRVCNTFNLSMKFKDQENRAKCLKKNHGFHAITGKILELHEIPKQFSDYTYSMIFHGLHVIITQIPCSIYILGFW